MCLIAFHHCSCRVLFSGLCDSCVWPRVTCWPMMGKLSLPQCAQLHWDDSRRNVDDVVSCWGIQYLDNLHTEPKRICISWRKKNTHIHTSAVTMLMPGPLWACLALMWVRSCSAHSLFTCEPIKVHRCLGMTYNMTFFPNMMDHYDQDIAATNMEVSPHSSSHMSWLIQFTCQYWPCSALANEYCQCSMFFFLSLSL